jgi:hypothetical protein
MRQGAAQVVLGGAIVLLLAACGSPGSGSPSPSASANAASSPTPAAVDPRLVIEDVLNMEVRLTRLDATRTATVKGHYDGIIAGQVIVLNGRTLEAVSHSGAVTRLGVLAVAPLWQGVGTVVVKPDLTQWLYTIVDTNTWTSRVHVGTASSDRVIATIPSPDGNAFFQPFAWNASGIYMVKEATGLGGAGPFLEYHFDLATFDMSAGRATVVSPDCLAYNVLDDGTLICGRAGQGYLEVRTPAGQTRKIQVTIGGSATDYDFWAYSHVALSPDNKRLIAARNGAKDPVINYQMVIAELTASSASPFGPMDYVPDAWLPDGRVVADHWCVQFEGAGPCDATLNGTYIFSADGRSRDLFYKLPQGSAVVGYV